MHPALLAEAMRRAFGQGGVCFALLLLLAFLALAGLLSSRCLQSGHRPRRRARVQRPIESRGRLCRPKPEWVRKEALRLAALLPHDGCRQLAKVFNRPYGDGETVGKTSVASLVARHRLEVLRLRREIKHRVPRPAPKNAVWGLDLTFAAGDSRPILALLDHGTRACLALQSLPRRTSLHILAAFFQTARQLGLPRALRVDNEPCLVSWQVRLCLALLGVRQQRTERCCPWQNGRVERLFLTLKGRLLPWLAAQARLHTQVDLDRVRWWYNHLRPHQHLGGATPAEAWDGLSRPSKAEPIYVNEWGGLLAGFYRPR